MQLCICKQLAIQQLYSYIQDATRTELYTAIKQKVPSSNNASSHVLSSTQELYDDSPPLTDYNFTSNLQLFNDPQVQILQNCAEKQVVGVSTPSIRACPFCGALVQHIEACKHVNCPACSRAFCFICLKKYEGGWQCGSYNKKCSPAPRQKQLHPRMKTFTELMYGHLHDSAMLLNCGMHFITICIASYIANYVMFLIL